MKNQKEKERTNQVMKKRKIKNMTLKGKSWKMNTWQMESKTTLAGPERGQERFGRLQIFENLFSFINLFKSSYSLFTSRICARMHT